MNTQPQIIIELSKKLNSVDQEKLQKLLEVVFSIDDTKIYDAKYYSMESPFADVIANEVMSMRAEDAIDCKEQ
ncbi:MAG: hypothetical protein WBG69_09310 [Arcobacteraceae bacterium]